MRRRFNRNVKYRITQNKVASLLLRKGKKFRIECLINKLVKRYYQKIYLYGWFSYRPFTRLVSHAVTLFRTDLEYKTKRKGKSGLKVIPKTVERLFGRKRAARWYFKLILKSKYAKTKPLFWQVYKSTLDNARNHFKELRPYLKNQRLLMRDNKYNGHFRWWPV